MSNGYSGSRAVPGLQLSKQPDDSRSAKEIFMLFFLGFDLEMTIDRVLIEADGPQLCAGTDRSGQRWLVFRSRSDRKESLWLCSPITNRALRLVETGRSAPRDALQHSSTGLVEVVSCVTEGAVPERCLVCGEIPETLLPPPDLMVAALAGDQKRVSIDRPSVRRVASHGPSTSDEPISTGALLCSAA
jgi:hypothetical protein